MKCRTSSGNHTQGKKKPLKELNLKSCMEVLGEAVKQMQDLSGSQTILIIPAIEPSSSERMLTTSQIGLIELPECIASWELRLRIAPPKLRSHLERLLRQDI